MISARLFTFVVLLASVVAPSFSEPKKASYLYPESFIQKAVDNAGKYEWAKAIRDGITAKAKPWAEASDEELWGLMKFGPRITRSWMVWSDGICPACRKDVKMYDWKPDIWNRRYKLQCPHCEEWFPKNNYDSFLDSGLDEKGIFDPAKADRTLLVNEEHPDPNDPKHLFGVDDGEGYLEGDMRWRFIGYYIIDGQWRDLVVGGVEALSEAYWVTGDKQYAHKAAIILDRVGDLFPSFEFREQGLVYEYGPHEGAVTVWHDACEEVRRLAESYDRIFSGMEGDAELVQFLAAKAEKLGLENSKSDVGKIRSNIEAGIFQNTLDNPRRIKSNFPRTPISLATIEAVLGWPDRKERVQQQIEDILKESLKEDGMTGEKGLTGYSSIFPGSFAQFISRFDRAQPGLLKALIEKFPDLISTYRFHIDTWCGQEYYPTVGDAGSFNARYLPYMGVYFNASPSSSEPSMFEFLWSLYEATDDPQFVQALYSGNAYKSAGLPYDLFTDDPEGFQKKVDAVIAEVGTEIKLGDVLKDEWGLSILRSGEGDVRRATWMSHDSGGGHGHANGLNLGLFAKGFNLLPDFGYPPVGYGGWSSPKALWYKNTAGHCTVTIDGKNQKTGKGKTTLWAPGDGVSLVRAAMPEIAQASQYERTAAMIDIDEADSYTLDLFRVRGGSDHALFYSSFYSKTVPAGLTLDSTTEYGYETQTRGFQTDRDAAAGWSVDFQIEDRDNFRPGADPVKLRVTGASSGTDVSIGECWVDGSQYGGIEQWVPRLMVRRQAAEGGLDSVFVHVLEPYSGDAPQVKSVEILPPALRILDQSAMVRVELANGKTDLFLEPDPAMGKLVKSVSPKIQFEGSAAWARMTGEELDQAVLVNGTHFAVGDYEVKVKEGSGRVRLAFLEDTVNVTEGEVSAVVSVTRGGQRLVVE